MVNIGPDDHDFTVNNNVSNSVTNENTVDIRTLDECLTDKIDNKMVNIVGTVEDKIQNATLTAIDNIITPKIKLVFRSMNTSTERDATSITANSERGEHIGITASFENVSITNNTSSVK